MLKNFKIYTKTLEILLWIFPKVNTFPKKQRFVLGQQIENTGLEILKLIIKANNQKDKIKKIEYLDELNTQLEILRSLLQIAQELRFMNVKSLEYIITQTDEVGRMTGGWLKNCLAD